MVPGLNTRVDLFRLLELQINTNLNLEENSDVTPLHDYMRLELSINHDIENSPNQMLLTTWVYYAEEEEQFAKSAYRIKAVSNTWLTWANTESKDIDLQTQSILMIIEGLSAALSLTRGVLSQTTSLGLEGEFILPFIDVEQFLEQYLNAVESDDDETDQI